MGRWKKWSVVVCNNTTHPPSTEAMHYNDVIMSTMASQTSSLPIVSSTVYSRCRPKKHQSSAQLAFVWGIHRWPVNSPHKGPLKRKMFPFDDVIMGYFSTDDVWLYAHQHVAVNMSITAPFSLVWTFQLWNNTVIRRLYIETPSLCSQQYGLWGG